MVRLTQVVDKALLLSLQERLTKTLRLSVAFEEPNLGLLNVIGQRGAICRVCTEFIDKPETGREKCLLSDSEAAASAEEKLKLGAKLPVEFYVCNGRFRNFVIPVSMAGAVLGNVYGGQFLIEPLKPEDPDFENNISKMDQLGMVRRRVLSYASLPDEDELSSIAMNNSINQEHIPDFVEAYKQMLAQTLKLPYVIDVVYLLHEIAATISSLGNAYYYNSVYSKLIRLLPAKLRITEADSLKKINSFLKQLKVQPLAIRMEQEIISQNQLIAMLLEKATEYYEDYLEALLDIYEKVDSSNDIFTNAKSLRMIGMAKLATRKLHGAVGTPLRDRALRKRGFFTEKINKLLDESESLLKSVENVLSSKGKMNRENVEQISRLVERIEGIRKDIAECRIPGGTPESAVDAIEALLEYVGDEESGLRKIVEYMEHARVLEKMSSKFRPLRENLNLRYDNVYLNWGGRSSSFEVSENARRLWSIDIDSHGPISAFSETLLESTGDKNVLQQTRIEISKILHCAPEQVIFTMSTTRGIALALSSIIFPPRDGKTQESILLSDLERDAGRNCAERIGRKFNVSIKEMEISQKTTEMIAGEIIRRVTYENVGVVILSHISFCTGRELEVGLIVKKVREELESKSPVFIIDGAEAVGHVPVDVQTIGCEFYVADGCRWLGGPVGTGFLIVDKTYLNENKEKFEIYENYAVSREYAPKDPKTGSPYEPATFNPEPHVGLTQTLKFISTLEESERIARIRSVSDKFREQIKEKLMVFGIQIVSHQSSTGIVLLRLENEDSPKFYEDLRKSLDKKFHVKCRVVERPFAALRFCVSWLNSDEELRLTVLALEKLLKEIPEIVERQKRAENSKNELEQKRREAKGAIERLHKKNTDKLQERADITRVKGIFKRHHGEQILEKKQRRLDEKKTELLKEAMEASSTKQLENLEELAEEEFYGIVEG